MKRLILASLFLPTLAFAQAPAAAPAAKSNDLSATEAILLQEVTNHRDWQSRAMTVNDQLAEAMKQLADMKGALQAANDKLAASKAIQPPSGGAPATDTTK